MPWSLTLSEEHRLRVFGNRVRTRGAEPFLTSCQFRSYSRTSQHFMETGGSLPCSQEPSTGPYPTSWPSQWSLSFWLSHQYPIRIPPLPHSCYMPCPSHPPWLDHSNYTWRRVQVMKLLILGTECWGEYLDPREMKWQESGENYVMRSFITCTVRQA
jgi:hypothetical protein